MAFPTDPRARLLGELRQRLEQAHGLAQEFRGRLTAGEAGEIEAATARLETLAQEFKTLAEEYVRLETLHPEDDDRSVAEERAALRDAVAGLARSSAIAGGLLERMVAVSRGRLGMLGTATSGYLPSGRGSEPDPRGRRLREWV